MKHFPLIISIAMALVLWVANQKVSAEAPNAIPLTNDVILADNFSNKVFTLRGVVRKVYTNKNGIKSIYFDDLRFSKKLKVSIFPQVGNIPDYPAGTLIEVTGYLTKYKDTVQLQPLDKNSIRVLKAAATSCESPVDFANLASMVGQTVCAKGVEIVGLSKFTSKKGRTHYRLKVRKGPSIYDGILFDGVWNDGMIAKIQAGGPLDVEIKVGTFRNDISLNVLKVY